MVKIPHPSVSVNFGKMIDVQNAGKSFFPPSRRRSLFSLQRPAGGATVYTIHNLPS